MERCRQEREQEQGQEVVRCKLRVEVVVGHRIHLRAQPE